MKNYLKVSSNESEILLSLLNSQLEIEEKRFLSTIIKRPVDHVIFSELGNYFTVQALNRLWNNANVCNEFMDTEFWMSSFKKASKCFCIPSAYLLKQFGKYAQSTYFPYLEELQKITSPFIFQQKPVHWGLIGLDLQKSSFFMVKI